jgi:hypothetical protein
LKIIFFGFVKQQKRKQKPLSPACQCTIYILSFFILKFRLKSNQKQPCNKIFYTNAMCV